MARPSGDFHGKAQRLTTQLLATIAFFFQTLRMQVEALGLPPSLEAALVERLIPALYLERVAARSTRAAPRHRLQTLSTQLLEPLRQPAHPLQALSGAERARLEQVAGECADRFQRSSSAVEGRNGQLSLHHHGRHRLSDRKLAALTAVHNFREPDLAPLRHARSFLKLTEYSRISRQVCATATGRLQPTRGFCDDTDVGVRWRPVPAYP